MSASRVVRTGLDRLLTDQIGHIKGRRIGLVCNASSITSDLRHAADVLAARDDLELVQLFGPEHGIRGDAQDMIAVSDSSIDRRTGLPLHSLYGQREASLWPPEHLIRDLDVVVFDIQDVGARYYTYVYTMAHVMEVAGRVDVPVVVCDRPNPIGGHRVEGNIVQDGYRSFVGRFRLPNRHGLTAGELAGYFQGEEGIECDTTVVPMEGWHRSMYFEDSGLPWVLPSPNMPTVDTAIVYPGGCFFEGTLLSEGRGQTRPFEIVGAPYIDGDRWALEASRELADAGYEGVHLRPLVFRPTFHKHVGQSCGGVQLHVTDREAFRPVMTAVALLKAVWRCWPQAARWRTLTYEFVADPIAIDLLDGSPALRGEVEADVSLLAIQARWDAERAEFDQVRKRYLEYPDAPPVVAPAEAIAVASRPRRAPAAAPPSGKAAPARQAPPEVPEEAVRTGPGRVLTTVDIEP